MQPIQQPIQQRSLSGAHFTREQDKTLAILDSIRQASKRFLNLLRQIEIARVRVDVERALAKSKEFLVHDLLRPSRARQLPLRPIRDRVNLKPSFRITAQFPESSRAPANAKRTRRRVRF